MRIWEIRAAGLWGATPEEGWNNELHPEDVVHTLTSVRSILVLMREPEAHLKILIRQNGGYGP